MARTPKRSVTIVAVVALVLGAIPLGIMAAHNFTDVPNDHVFHGDIEWLAEADVTRGCNPPANTLFCPEDNVTRGQMAAFLNRLANNQVVNAATAQTANTANTADTAGHADTADDADTLDGMDSSAFDTFIVAGALAGFVELGEPVTLTDVSFTAPSNGHMALTGTTSFAFSGEDLFADAFFWVQLNNDDCTAGEPIPAGFTHGTTAPDGTEPLLNSAAFTTGIEVPAGSHTLTLCGAGIGDVRQAGISGVVSPSANNVVDVEVEEEPPPLSAPDGTRR